MGEAVCKPSYEELEAEVARLKEDLRNVLTQFQALKKHVFGRRSEKLDVVSSDQLPLFLGKHPEKEVPEPEHEVQSYKRSKRNGRKPLPEDLPRERIEYEPEEKACSCCGEELKKIGEEVSEELDYVPASFVVREHVKIKKACRNCDSEGVKQGVLPADVQVIEKGRAGAGLLSHVFVSKYCDHQPLHRQEQIYARAGIELSRSTMCDWVRQGAELLEPICEELIRQILTYPAIYADETILKVQDPDKEGLHQGYLWGALGPPGVYFHYSKSRASEVALELFSEYQGYVHTDAYAGYNPVFLPEGCKRVGCFAHVRRKFIEVQKLAEKDVGKVLKLIAELYKVERAAKKLSDEERAALRQKKSLPVLEKLKAMLETLRDITLPQHPLVKAINYALAQWEELTIYTTKGFLDIDNNPIERQIRPVALGRKNYLFAGSHDGAKRAAIFYSLINTCKMHKINPFNYLKDVLKRVNTHTASRVAELTPLGWKEKFAE